MTMQIIYKIYILNPLQHMHKKSVVIIILPIIINIKNTNVLSSDSLPPQSLFSTSTYPIIPTISGNNENKVITHYPIIS